jgi:hypothetical protein
VSTGSSCRRVSPIAKRVPELIEDASVELPGLFWLLIDRLRASQAASPAGRGDRGADQGLASDQRCGRSEKVPDRPLTATALVASVGDVKNFDNARQFAAWLGVVPRQHSSGGKPTLLA